MDVEFHCMHNSMCFQYSYDKYHPRLQGHHTWHFEYLRVLHNYQFPRIDCSFFGIYTPCENNN